jgi:hypothetical protein
MCVVDDYDRPAFLSRTWQRSRKPRHCEECNEQLLGQRYERSTGMWDRRIDTFFRCEMCAALAQAIEDADCSWAYGSLLNDAEATTQSYEHAEEAPAAVGRVGGLLFAIRERRADRRDAALAAWRGRR